MTFKIDLRRNDWFKFVKEHRKIYDKVEETNFTFKNEESYETAKNTNIEICNETVQIK